MGKKKDKAQGNTDQNGKEEAATWRSICGIALKSLLSLSKLLLVCLVNGLGENFPLNSKVTLANEEHLSGDPPESSSDVFFGVDGCVIHLKAQTERQDGVEAWCLDYDHFLTKDVWQGNTPIRVYPATYVIYLGRVTNIPGKSTYRIFYPNSGYYDYTVKNFVCLDKPIEELEEKRLYALIPFQVIQTMDYLFDTNGEILTPTEEEINKLETLFLKIVESIDDGYNGGYAELGDEIQLDEIALTLYNHITVMYENKGGDKHMLDHVAEVLHLADDKVLSHVFKLEEEKDNALAQLAERDAQLEQQGAQLEQQGAELAQRDARIIELERELEALKKSAAG